MKPGTKLFFACALLAASATHSAREAKAQDTAAAAEALFQQGKALTDKKAYAEACPKFEASFKLDKQLGTLLNLADCEEHLGKLASAWARWGEARELASKTGDKRAEFAEQHQAALLPKLSMLEITIAKPVPTLDVMRDGTRLDPGAYSVPLPIDPGAHTITIQRGKQLLKKQEISTKQGETQTLAFDLVALDKAIPPDETSGLVFVSQPSGLKTAGFVIGGVGIASVVGAVVLEAVALSHKSTAKQGDCQGTLCTPTGLDEISTARTFANAGQWVGIGGITLVAVGVTLLIAAPSKARVVKTPVVGAWILPGAGGVSYQGVL
jgi:hypothetical protein